MSIYINVLHTLFSVSRAEHLLRLWNVIEVFYAKIIHTDH